MIFALTTLLGNTRNPRSSAPLIFVVATKHGNNQVIRNRCVNREAERTLPRAMRAEGVHTRNRHRKELRGTTCNLEEMPRSSFGIRNAYVALVVVHTKGCGEVLDVSCCTKLFLSPCSSLPYTVQNRQATDSIAAVVVFLPTTFNR
jgi:hypothetical protein